jgi:eukaryotic-like serine/threonine-protein kinase
MTKTERYRRVSKFELHDLIGEGAMGVVWKAYDTVIRRYVALKLLPTLIGKTTDARQRFLREARAAGVLQHPNLVTLYDLGDAEGQLYIAMELVEGRDLSELISSTEPLALERKLDMVVELLEGLTYAHERGVIHRDIKPSNVRVASDGRVKIMDFGIAHLQSAEVTGTGAIVGTPNYMAPEQVTNGPITPATDLFSVGCLLYELLSYHKPFDGDTVHGVLYQVLTTDPKPLRTMAPSIPAALERVVSKALNKVPEDRYQSARQMQQVLLGIRAALSGATDTTQRLSPRWSPIPGPMLRLVTHASLRLRVAVLSALATVVVVLAYVSRGTVQSAELPPSATGDASADQFDAAPPPAPTPPTTLKQFLAAPLPPSVSGALVALRDSALAARDRARRVGAIKNNVPSVVLAETMLQTAEQGVRSGDQAHASGAYLSAVSQYRKARVEVESLRKEAELAIQRATPVVKALTAPLDAATRAATSLARAESLYAAMDYPLAASAAQDAERVGVAAGVAPPSPQPREPRAALGVLLLDLARAVASERVTNLQQLFPSMTDVDAKSWQTFFERAATIEARFTPNTIRVTGNRAAATVGGEYRFVPRGGGAQREERITLEMQFVKTPTGWRVASVGTPKPKK